MSPGRLGWSWVLRPMCWTRRNVACFAWNEVGEIIFELPQVEAKGYFFMSSRVVPPSTALNPNKAWHVGSSCAQPLNAASIASRAYCLVTLKAEVTVGVASIAHFGTAAARTATDRTVHRDCDRRGRSEPRARGSKRGQSVAQAL